MLYTRYWARPHKQRREGVYKPIPQAWRERLEELRRDGHTTMIKRGPKTFQATWKWKTGLLFPAERPTAKRKHLSTKSVESAIKRARSSLAPDAKNPDIAKTDRIEKIRSHSGKHRAVNDYKNAGIPTPAWQPVAEHKCRQTADAVYGKLNQAQAGQILRRSPVFQCRRSTA